MSRPSETTRQDLVEAAISVFADKGFEAGSVREIAGLANANQAAVSYHFGGKDGLYREVLRRSLAAFDIPSFDLDRAATLDRAQAVREFLNGQLTSLRRHSEINRYYRIFAWENVARTSVFVDFIATERLPIVEICGALVRRYLPHGTSEEHIVTMFWLLHQTEPFTRDPRRLTQAPIGLTVDAPFIERLSETLGTLAVAGLEALAARAQPRVAAAV
jgi:AcrR family transcriptional regulator